MKFRVRIGPQAINSLDNQRGMSKSIQTFKNLCVAGLISVIALIFACLLEYCIAFLFYNYLEINFNLVWRLSVALTTCLCLIVYKFSSSFFKLSPLNKVSVLTGMTLGVILFSYNLLFTATRANPEDVEKARQSMRELEYKRSINEGGSVLK